MATSAQTGTLASDSPQVGSSGGKHTNKGQFLQGLALVAIFGVMVGLPLTKTISPEYAWLIATALMSLFVCVLGLWIAKDPLGILINNRNLMSMSHLQATLWTILVVPGFIVLALYRLSRGVANPLAIMIPPELWAAMGISLASLVGTPLLLNPKTDETPSDVALKNTSDALGDRTSDEIKDQAIGTLFSNASPDQARMSDMFQGDEVGNKGTVDLAKVQMFAFSVCLILVYGAGIWQLLASLPLLGTDKLPGASESLPLLTKDSVYLLLISHAGYLSSKAVSHTDQDKSQ